MLGSSYINPFGAPIELHNSVFESALDQKTAFSDVRQHSVVISFWLFTCTYRVSKKQLPTWSNAVGHAIIFIMAFTIAPVGVA